MIMINSDSSQVAQFGRDPQRDVLRVKFRSGDVYEYEGVDAGKFKEMQAADSHGKFLTDRIKPFHFVKKLEPASDNPLAENERSI